MQASQFAEAIVEFDRAIELRPNFPLALNGRGYARMRLGQYKQSLSDFTSAIRLNPSYTNAYHNRAAAFRAINQLVEAEADSVKERALSLR